jgi:hypothetical protein
VILVVQFEFRSLLFEVNTMRKSVIVSLAGLVFGLATLSEALLSQEPTQVQPAQVQPGQAQQGRGRGRGPQGPARPTPRNADGRPILGPIPGELGVWLPGAGTFAEPDNPREDRVFAGGFSGPPPPNAPKKPKLSEVPFQPWARALYEYRRGTEFEPHTRCKASGGARQFLTPYGVEFVELPELQRIFIMDIGGPHSYRIIYMDGRPHPKDLAPSYYGHSIGHWEGDTLVVDNVGFNERFWMDREGSPHTEQLHYIERFTRLDMNTMKYEITIDDPGAYTATWNTGFMLRWSPGQELFEYVCQDNNYAPELMLGSEKSVDRTSRIVP